MVKVIDEDIQNCVKEKALKFEQMERIDTNMTKIVPIMMKTKEGAVEDYFNNILQKFYSAEERQFCRDTIETWSRDLSDVSTKDFEFNELLDELLVDDTIVQGRQNDEKFKQLMRVALNLVYLKKWKSSPDFEVFALQW